MRRILLTLALAGAPLLAQQANIAFFIPDLVVQSSQRGQEIFTELVALERSLMEKIRVKETELQRLDQQIRNPNTPPKDRARLQITYAKLERDRQRLQEDSKAELDKMREKLVGQFNQEVLPIVEMVRIDWKLQAVLNYSPTALAAADGTWLKTFSTEVARRYDAKFKKE